MLKLKDIKEHYGCEEDEAQSLQHLAEDENINSIEELDNFIMSDVFEKFLEENEDVE